MESAVTRPRILIYLVSVMTKHWRRRNILYRVYMRSKAWFAWKKFRTPWKAMHVIWVTWTDGKSTTSACVYHILKQAWYRVGLISTVYIDVWTGMTDNTSHMTSLDHMLFWKLIQEAEKNWVTHLVLEVSSHALYQYRTWPIRFDGVWCTNITREHLDFHGTLNHYAKTKAELFSRGTDTAIWVLPDDFSYTSLFTKSWLVTKTFWKSSTADIWVDNLKQQGTLSFDLHQGDQTDSIQTHIVWAFNADNMMIASVLCQHAGVKRSSIIKGLESFTWLPGRQELIHTSEWITAMIDFAVTPDGLATLYAAVRDMWYDRLIAVFGATGNRDQGKRPKMGTIAAQLCDIVVITEDENYHEDGLQIMKQVEVGALWETWSSVEMVQDRTQAIRHGLELARSGDIVIVTWMANYTSRAMNEGNIPWNEKEVIETQMRELRYTIQE